MSTRPADTALRRRPVGVIAAVAVAVFVVVLVVWLLVGRGGEPGGVVEPEPSATPTAAPSAEPTPSPEPSTEPTGSGSATPTPSEEPTATTGAGEGTPLVVWHQREQESLDGVRFVLVPERAFADVPAGDTPEATTAQVRAALDDLLSTPALDSDHANPWAAGTPGPGDAVLGVTLEPDGTTVDVPAEAFDGSLGTDVARLAVAALVRTVVSNGGEAPVAVLVDGEPGAEVWGALVLDEPLEPATDDLAGGWVLDPYDGQRVPAGTLTVSGTATAFEANVQWEVLVGGDAVVDSGFTMAGANGEYGPFSFDLDLEPGTYTIRVFEGSAAGPDEGVPVVWEDTTTVEVV
ncbi:Gmad2 immunoglobulin-like domain-containing protein [Aquipuribacter nitratireducens]|uniref:Gmad2 immunoglobulin-like domain-containing protein n=1 Tax=Aquipuribacter nitratireducens TaxID=650104 RepID=A0ABW0GKA1_9MICO